MCGILACAWLGEEKRSRCPSRYLFRTISIFIYSVFASSSLSLASWIRKTRKKRFRFRSLCLPMRRAGAHMNLCRYEARNNKSENILLFLWAHRVSLATIRDSRALCNKSKEIFYWFRDGCVAHYRRGKGRFDANWSDITSPSKPNYKTRLSLAPLTSALKSETGCWRSCAFERQKCVSLQY